MSLVSDLYDQVSRLEAERDKLKAELALAMKVPSVAAMHSYLDTVCAKQNVQFAAERDTLRAQVEAMRAALACPHCEGSGRIPVTGRGAAFGVTNHCPYCEPRP